MLPLETNPWERVPTTRILQMLKYLATEKLGPKSQQVWVSIILFRCFLEGFGTTPNFRAAGNFLKEAAVLGSYKARALLRVCHKSAAIVLPPDINVQKMLLPVVIKEQNYIANTDKSTQPPLRRFTNSLCTILQARSGILPQHHEEIVQNYS